MGILCVQKCPSYGVCPYLVLPSVILIVESRRIRTMTQEPFICCCLSQTENILKCFSQSTLWRPESSVVSVSPFMLLLPSIWLWRTVVQHIGCLLLLSGLRTAIYAAVSCLKWHVGPISSTIGTKWTFTSTDVLLRNYSLQYYWLTGSVLVQSTDRSLLYAAISNACKCLSFHLMVGQSV